MDEIVKKIGTTGCEINVLNCNGDYDTIIRVKYGVTSHDLGWVYLKEGKILLIHKIHKFYKRERWKHLSLFIFILVKITAI